MHTHNSHLVGVHAAEWWVRTWLNPRTDCGCQLTAVLPTDLPCAQQVSARRQIKQELILKLNSPGGLKKDTRKIFIVFDFSHLMADEGT